MRTILNEMSTVPRDLQSKLTEVIMLFSPVRGIKNTATARNQTLFGVTSAIAHSADNLFTIEIKSAMIILALNNKTKNYGYYEYIPSPA